MTKPNPLWYKDGIIYQLHVRAFSDANGDGIGDFKGLTQKLDYIRDLGVTAIWMLPFYPSPLKDDGYDIADYSTVNPIYGTLDDFHQCLKRAHDLGLKVITELVLNHTSDQHEWFQKSRRAEPGSYWRNFYVWSDTPDKYRDVRVIFKDFEPSNWSYDPLAKAYFWHRFYSHQPDLNFDNPDVQEALLKVVDYWFEMGVDGLRLDAVPYLFEREGTSCENLPETHVFLRRLRAHIDGKFENRMLLAEANQWPEDAINYFGKGDECHVAFHFPLMPRMYMSLAMEDRFPVIDILEQTPAIPDNCQWAIFLRNHDELTLEMVTDEERDYMYRIYAQEKRARINLGIRRRLAPLMKNDRRKIELLNGLLFSLPGIPIVYYGDEIGMGDNIYLGDRNGVRTPIQWSPDRNAGFSTANPQSLFLPVIIDPEYHYEALNVEAQQSNPNSLLWWMKRMMAVRKQHEALLRGDLKFLNPDNRKVLAFVRQHEDDIILVVANLSRLAQYVELNLNDYEGLSPIELFGQTVFPVVAKSLYNITLTPYSFYVFKLEQVETEQTTRSEEDLPQIAVRDSWASLFRDETYHSLEQAILSYLKRSYWYANSSRKIKTLTITDVVPLEFDESLFFLTPIQIEFLEGENETYSLPICFVASDGVDQLMNTNPKSAIAKVVSEQGEPGLLIDCAQDKIYNQAMFDLIRNRATARTDHSELVAEVGSKFDQAKPKKQVLAATSLRGEHGNTCMIFEEKFVLKHFRKVESGLSPEVEMLRFLTEKTEFRMMPLYMGSVQLHERGHQHTIGVLQSYITHESDAWSHTLDFLSSFYERILAKTSLVNQTPELAASQVVMAARVATPQGVAEHLGLYLRDVKLMGQLTAKMHLALSTPTEDPDFQVEPFSGFSRRSFYQSMRTLTDNSMMALERYRGKMNAEEEALTQKLVACDQRIFKSFHEFMDRQVPAKRMRVHGDFHLSQILATGKDFAVVDFEGEPSRSIGQRRLKHSPLRDIAGMLRSFHYATELALIERVVRKEDQKKLIPWAQYVQGWIAQAYVRSYLEAMGGSELLPPGDENIQLLLDMYLIEKALYEIGFDLKNRPEYVQIPLKAVLQYLAET